MLRGSFASLQPLLQLELALVENATITTGTEDCVMDQGEKQILHMSNQAQRRLSLMTALKISLENASIVDTNVPTKKVERRLSTSYSFLASA
jgi:hypothetical protein